MCRCAVQCLCLRTSSVLCCRIVLMNARASRAFGDDKWFALIYNASVIAPLKCRYIPWYKRFCFVSGVVDGCFPGESVFTISCGFLLKSIGVIMVLVLTFFFNDLEINHFARVCSVGGADFWAGD